MLEPDPNNPLTYRGWRPKTPSGWGLVAFLAVCALVAGALIYFKSTLGG